MVGRDMHQGSADFSVVFDPMLPENLRHEESPLSVGFTVAIEGNPWHDAGRPASAAIIDLGLGARMLLSSAGCSQV